jgi:plasmid stabilization system protein ParE
MTYALHPGAEDELTQAALYYAEHASKAVAAAFLDEFDHVVDKLVNNQQIGSHCDDGLRLYHFDRFPYTVIYEVSDTFGPQIFAVAHQRREPGYWRDRVL